MGRSAVRHLGTDINYIVLKNLYEELSAKVEFHFNAPVEDLRHIANLIGAK